MKKNRHMKSRGLYLATLLAVSALLISACGGGDVKPDPGVTTPAEREILAKQLGVSMGALESFEQAAAELSKKAPDLKKAEGLLQAALKDSPNFLEAQYNMGIVEERLGRYENAIKAYNQTQKLDKLNSHSAKLLLAIGRAQSLSGQPEEAVRSFEEALRLDPNNLDLLNSVGSVYLKAGRTKEAIDYVKKVLREENENVTALNTLAQVYAAENNQSMAVYVFKKAARASLGTFTTDEELNTEPAVLVLTDKVKTEKVDGPQAADILNNLGLMYMKMDEMPLAVYNFNAASKLDPTDIESRLNTGAIYLQYLNYEGARDLFGQALKSNPSNCTARLGLAASNFGIGGDSREDAVKNYDTFLADCNAKDASVHLQLERLHERMQNFDKAIEHCLKYVEFGKPDDKDPVNASYCKALENMKDMASQPMDPEGGELLPDDGLEEMAPDDGLEALDPEDDGLEPLEPEDDGMEALDP